MNRKSFLARLIAVPAALLGINLVADASDYHPIEEITLTQLRDRVDFIRKCPLTFEDTAEYAELRRMMMSDLLTFGEVSYLTKGERINGFSSLTFQGKTYHFYKGRLIRVE